ncbi:hypothetical protein [Desulfosediminicola ganghwensis]|uniref:hypothetical protein n=1 Tax=Desulfosediminicola ganghwensis TaxID=2569540 RepID=UPI0010AC95EA|nr:hypothetical protein [Desulfosediminicola ganghwensis]
MEHFKHRRKEFKFWKHTGAVLGDQKKYSKTYVSSSGGEGYVGPNGGVVEAAQVSSSVSTKHEFWIRKEDGTEKSIQLSDCDIPLREGHKITVVAMGPINDKSGYFTLLINHSANTHHTINSADNLNGLFKIDQLTGKSLLISIALFFAIS